MPRGPITTHVLDTAAGRPAASVGVTLEQSEEGGWRRLGSGSTDEDGRVQDLLPGDHRLAPGAYRLRFAVAEYLQGGGFYPEIPIVFRVVDPDQHYHVPLLLSPFGYSTYRGS